VIELPPIRELDPFVRPLARVTPMITPLDEAVIAPELFCMLVIDIGAVPPGRADAEIVFWAKLPIAFEAKVFPETLTTEPFKLDNEPSALSKAALTAPVTVAKIAPVLPWLFRTANAPDAEALTGLEVVTIESAPER
jgi:hypothetical protein